jgi:hypothetical protein
MLVSRKYDKLLRLLCLLLLFAGVNVTQTAAGSGKLDF